MVVGAKVCELTEDLLWFVCGLYVGILTSSLSCAGRLRGPHMFQVAVCYHYCKLILTLAD